MQVATPDDSQFERTVQLAVKAQLRLAEKARRDPSVLYDMVMREERTNTRLRIALHQRLMLEFAQAHKRCLIRAPVGFGKSYCVTALTLHKLGNDPGERGAFISGTVGNAQKPLGMVRTTIEESRDLRVIFPELRRSTRRGDPWTQSKLVVARANIARDPSLVAVGDQGRLPGSRLSWILPDDLLNAQNTSDPAARERVKKWFGTSVLDRADREDLERGLEEAHIVFVNTPWNPDDMTFYLENPPDRGGLSWPSLTLDAHGDVLIRNTDWDSDLVRPALTPDPEQVRHRLVAHDSPAYARMCGIEVRGAIWVDEKDEVPLWPEVYPFSVLNKILQGDGTGDAMGALDYARAYRCRVRDDANAPVKLEWIENCKKKARELGFSAELKKWDGKYPTFTGVDPAFGQKKGNDKSAVITFTVLPSGHKLILEALVGQWPGPELVTMILDASQRFNSIVAVEGNAAQKLLVDMALERNASALIEAVNTGREKHDHRFGIQSVFIEVQNCGILFPNDRGRCSKGIQSLISALLSHDPNAHTADEIMALWVGSKYARLVGAGMGGASTGFAAGLRAR